MSGRKLIDPPVPILDVLNAALSAIGQDKRFRGVPGGHMDVSWCQPSRTKGDARPARYRITFECQFRP
jgi:hypothetical protein